jgi:hypothetical protein
MIDGPRLFQHEGLPVGRPWPDVQRLIASASGDSARDTARAFRIRDRAVSMLLATYGFRSDPTPRTALSTPYLPATWWRKGFR